MNQVVFIGIVISMILGVSGYLASGNFIVGIFSVLLPVIYFLVIARPMVTKYQTKISRFRECYHFINNFIVSLSIKNSVSSALETTVEAMPEKNFVYSENVDAFSVKEKMQFFSNYFRFHVYSLFIDLINLYEEQGGNILDMSRYLLEETRQIEDYIFRCQNIARKRIVEFAILWVLTLVIMVVMRFSLSQFFANISKQIFFPIGIGAIILFALVSIHIAIMKMCNLKIKGWDDSEKI